MSSEMKAWLHVAIDVTVAAVVCGVVNGFTPFKLEMGAYLGIIALKTAYDLKFKESTR